LLHTFLIPYNQWVHFLLMMHESLHLSCQCCVPVNERIRFEKKTKSIRHRCWSACTISHENVCLMDLMRLEQTNSISTQHLMHHQHLCMSLVELSLWWLLMWQGMSEKITCRVIDWMEPDTARTSGILFERKKDIFDWRCMIFPCSPFPFNSLLLTWQGFKGVRRHWLLCCNNCYKGPVTGAICMLIIREVKKKEC
jgi:hypothetical protein